MKKMLSAALGACLAAGVTIGPAARADAPDAAPHQRFDLGDFPLESGQVIEKGSSPMSPTAPSTTSATTPSSYCPR